MPRPLLVVLSFVLLSVVLISCGQSQDGYLPPSASDETITPSFGGNGRDEVAYLGASANGSVCAAGQGAPDRTINADFVRCFSPDGETVWSRFYSASTSLVGAEVEFASVSGLAVTPGGETYLLEYVLPVNSGTFTTDSAFVYLHKYGTLGVLEWSRLLPDVQGGSYKLRIDAQGNPYIFSYIVTANDGEGAQYLMKYDALGNQAWRRTLEPLDESYKTAFVVAPDGSSYTEDYNGCLTHYDGDGYKVWTKLCDFERETANDGLAVSADGSVYTFTLQYAEENGIRFSFPVLLSLSREGEVRWRRPIRSGDNAYEIFALAADAQGNVYLTGLVTTGLPSPVTGGGGGISETKVFVRKYRPNGSFAWNRHFDNPGRFEYGTALAVVGEDDLYVGGATNGTVNGVNNGGVRDAFVLKLGAQGKKVWSH